MHEVVKVILTARSAAFGCVAPQYVPVGCVEEGTTYFIIDIKLREEQEEAGAPTAPQCRQSTNFPYAPLLASPLHNRDTDWRESLLSTHGFGAIQDANYSIDLDGKDITAHSHNLLVTSKHCVNREKYYWKQNSFLFIPHP